MADKCPDCGREKWQHTPVEDFPCGARTSNSKALLEEIARWIRTVRDDVFEHGNICGRTQRSGEDLLRRIDTVVMDSGSHETCDQLVRDWYAAIKGMETSDLDAKLTAQRRVVDFERKLMGWAASHSQKALEQLTPAAVDDKLKELRCRMLTPDAPESEGEV